MAKVGLAMTQNPSRLNRAPLHKLYLSHTAVYTRGVDTSHIATALQYLLPIVGLLLLELRMGSAQGAGLPAPIQDVGRGGQTASAPTHHGVWAPPPGAFLQAAVAGGRRIFRRSVAVHAAKGPLTAPHAGQTVVRGVCR